MSDEAASSSDEPTELTEPTESRGGQERQELTNAGRLPADIRRRRELVEERLTRAMAAMAITMGRMTSAMANLTGFMASMAGSVERIKYGARLYAEMQSASNE